MGILSKGGIWRTVAGILLFVVALATVVLFFRSRLDETVVRSAVITTIQSEAPESFYVTGVLQLTATSEVEDTRYLLPDILRLNLGTTRAIVRMPGKVAYGFDVRSLTSDHVAFRDDGVVEVSLPGLSVFSVEPNLNAMEVQTDVGWARTHAASGQESTQAAIRQAQDILRKQAESHLETNTQSRINTAQALEKLLTPVLQSAGLVDPKFSFQIGPHLVMEPEG